MRGLFALLALCGACSAIVGPDASTTRISVFDQVWNDFDLHYSLFDAKQIDWNAARAFYRPRVIAITDDSFTDKDAELSSVIANMLGTLRDDHVLFRGSRVTSGRGVIRAVPVNTTPFVQYVGSFSDGLSFGSVNPSIGYINIGTFDGTGWVAEIDSALTVLDSAKVMIVDVRNNDGGFLDNALSVAGRFAQKTTAAAYVRYRNGPAHTDFTAPIAQDVSPSGTRRFSGTVYVLTARNTVSAAELFVMAMKALGHTTVVGDTTAGETGGPFARELQNGWSYQFPESIEFTLDGHEFEGIGLGPDVFVRNLFGPTGLVVDAQISTAIALGSAAIQANQRSLGANVRSHRGNHCRASRGRSRADGWNVEHDVERIQLEHIVMRRPRRRRGRCAIVRAGRADLSRAVGELRQGGNSSASEVAPPGIFQTIQCSMSSVPLPIATSRSCTISTKLTVLSGAPLHASGGESSWPGCAYFSGMRAPSANADDVSVITTIGPRPPPRPPPPPPPPPPPRCCA